ncbi:MAG: 30S ribosome-binding factor RbfA [Verrucomicrobiales bacterium]
MNHRLLRVRELLKRELSDAIAHELTFENALITVSGVDVTPDLKQGHVFVSVIGDEAAKSKVLKTLEDNRVILQKRLSKRVVLKFTPHLHFKLDDSFERGVNLINLMDGLEELPEEDFEEDPEDPEDSEGAARDGEE